jgi:hypothetical protein
MGEPDLLILKSSTFQKNAQVGQSTVTNRSMREIYKGGREHSIFRQFSFRLTHYVNRGLAMAESMSVGMRELRRGLNPGNFRNSLAIPKKAYLASPRTNRNTVPKTSTLSVEG